MSKNLSDIFPPTEIGGGGGGIEEAPKTGKMYARKDAAWEEFATANLDDGNQDGEILTWDTSVANWTHDDTMIVKGGNVGIGTDSPASQLSVASSGTGERVALSLYHGVSNYWGIGSYTDQSFRIAKSQTLEDATACFAIDRASGNVGIGGTPGTRSIDEAKALAKTKLTEWKAEVKKRTAEQPEASTQEIILEVTDGDFGVMPSEQALAEKLMSRAIGGGDAKLQVAGDGYFRGTLTVNRGSSDGSVIDVFRDGVTVGSIGVNSGSDITIGSGDVGVRFSIANNAIYPITTGGINRDNATDLGVSTVRFKDAYFSGDVSCATINGALPFNTRHIIETLETLRSATKDETTVEGLRDAIGNAVGGLIEKFEAMQADAVTQEIPE
jgi:hypothetical protein